MLTITNVSIQRFRSILSLNFSIQKGNNLVAIYGQNNVGKTNTLRAINLFFHPELYTPEFDMPKIKHATGGQSIHPKIEMTFWDDKSDTYYDIWRDIKLSSSTVNDLGGITYKLNGKKKKDKRTLTDGEANGIIDKIEFVYIESINIFMPELIESITEGIINVEYDKVRFSQTKKELKTAYDTYVDGLSSILGKFADDISNTFKFFRDNWKVEFIVPKNSETFRDLISEDIKLSLDDNGSVGVLDKGAGLQRLATMLLNFEMLSRINKNKSVVVCIDEPDVYLHEGLQRKLKLFFDQQAENMQLFYTTHSKIFINPYNMNNVIFLDAKHYPQHSVRKNRDIDVVETFFVDSNTDDGYERICNHLGIEKSSYDILQRNNVLVEGGCDKKYLTELGNFFGITVPNIEVLNGAENALKFLDFYESYYHNSTSSWKPTIKILLDNDIKGREVFQKVSTKTYNFIEVKCILIDNYLGNSEKALEKNNTNNEIEDLMYPEIICYLINALLSKKQMNTIDSKKICKNICKKSFSSKGILELCEHEKNEKNPDVGAEISFVSSGNSTNRLKEGLAGLFDIQANQKILNLLRQCDIKYPNVKSQVERLFEF